MQVIQILVELAVFVLLLYVAFFKSYFQEKGKNLATQEDISRITDLVESVKSRLQLSLQAKINLKREEHDAVLSYYAAISAWVQSISSCHFSGISYENMERLNTLQQQLDEMQHTTQVAVARVEILAQNQKILAAARHLIAKVVDFHHHALEKFPEYGLLCIEAQNVKHQSQEPDQLERYRSACNEQVKFFGKFKAEQTKIYTSLLPDLESHRQLVSAHLQSIAEAA